MLGGPPPESAVQWLATLFFQNFSKSCSLPCSPHPFQKKRSPIALADLKISECSDSTSQSARITVPCHPSLLQIF